MRVFLAFVLGVTAAALLLSQKRSPRQMPLANAREEDVIDHFLSNQDSAPTKPTLH